MSRQVVQRATKLDPLDREALMEQVSASKEQIREIDSRDTEAAGTLDRGVLAKQVAHKEAILNKDDDLVARGVQKDRLQKRSDELEKRLKENMPTKTEMWAKPGTVEAERAIKKHIEFEAKHGDEVREWKELQNRIEPDDPLGGNVERIRP